MLTASIIVALSVLLLLGWFRYSCVMILNAKTSRSYAPRVATANRLQCLDGAERARTATSAAALAEVAAFIDRDHRLLVYLLGHGTEFAAASAGIEIRLLTVSYRMLRVVYRLLARWSLSRSKRIVMEMAEITCYLANVIGQQASFASGLYACHPRLE